MFEKRLNIKDIYIDCIYKHSITCIWRQTQLEITSNYFENVTCYVQKDYPIPEIYTNVLQHYRTYHWFYN